MAGDHSGGGSFQLAELIDQYGEHIYRDLHEYAGGLNLVDALREGSGYSPRQILLLIKGLPLASATMAHLRPGGSDEHRGWDVDRYLSVALIDAVRENTFATVAVASGKKKPKPPEPMYRPKDKVADKQPNKNNPFLQRLEAAKRAKARNRVQGV